MSQSIVILDQTRSVVATAVVKFHENHSTGEVDVDHIPVSLRQLFEEYERIVNNRIFSLLDQLEDQISRLSLSVVFEGGEEHPLCDVQPFLTARTLSFKI